MTDLQELIETEWDIDTCHCAECYRDEWEPADLSAMVWLIGAGAVWVTAACLWLWY